MAEYPVTYENTDLDDYAQEQAPTFTIRAKKQPKQYKQAPLDAIDKEIARTIETSQGPGLAPVVPADKARIQRSLTTSSTLDIPFRQAYDADEIMTPNVQATDKDFFSKAGTSFMRGVGNMMVMSGRALDLATPAGSEANRLGGVYREYGQRLQNAYMPTTKPPEFTWSRMVDPDWWATTAAEGVPITLSLIPAAIVGAYAGAGTAGVLGLGAFGKLVLGALGGAAFSRSVEAGFEAAGTYEEAISRGMPDEQAHNAASTTFKANLALTGVDAAQFALAFTPMRMLGANVNKILSNRILSVATRFAGVAGLEAGEEMTQEAIQQYALGDPIAFTPQMKEAGALGAIFGVGLAGAGSVFQGMVSHVESNMKPEQAQAYEASKQQMINNGVSEEQATIAALDQFTEEPGGKAVVEKAFKDLVDISEGKEVEPVTQEEMQKSIETIGEITALRGPKPATGDVAEPELMSQEIVDSIISGENTLEDIFGLEKQEVEAAFGGGAPIELAPSQVKHAIRLTTGQIKLAELIREDVALTAALRKASMAARIAFKVGSEAATEKAKAAFNDVMIKAKVKAEAQGYAKGERHGQKITRDELITSFKDSQKTAEETRKALRDLIQEELPIEEQGKFLDALVSRLTKGQQTRVLDRMIATQERLSKKELIDELGELKHYNNQISVEYNRRLQEIVGDISTKHFRPDTIRKLAALRDYADDNGMPSGVSHRLINDLHELSLKDAQFLTVEELERITSAANHLIEMGKLKQKLKYRYKERERQAALNKLVASTHNLDFDSTKKGHKLAAGSQNIYMNALNSLRVGQMIDGFKDGQNSELVKNLAFAEKNAQWAIKIAIDGATEEMVSGLESGVLSEAQQIKIMINIRAQEGAENATLALLEKYDYQEVPDLTPAEQKVIDVLKKYMNAHVNAIAALYEETTNQPFVKEANYILPLKYEGEAHVSPEEAIVQQFLRKTQTARGFTETRKKGVTRLPRVDLFEVFEQGLNEQLWYLYMQPELDNIKQLVKDKEYINKAGETAANWWKDHLDIVARRGWSAKANHNAFSHMLKAARNNITKATLGYKVSSIIMQPFAVFDAMAYATSQYGPAAARDVISEFAKAWVVPGYAAAYGETSQAIRLRTGGEVAIDETLEKLGRSDTVVSKFIRGGLSLLQKADIRTSAATQAAMEKILTKHGVTNAKEEAGLLMEMAASSSDVTFRPHVLASGEAARTWFTFQSFALNRFAMISHDLIGKGLIKGEAKAKIGAAIGLGIIIAATLAENEARKFLYQVILRRERKERSLLADTLLAIPSQVPFFGDIYQTVAGRPGEVPAIKLVTDIMRTLTIPLMEKPQAQAKAGLRAAEAAATLALGIPGTSQVFDVAEGMLFPDKEKTGKPKKALAAK